MKRPNPSAIAYTAIAIAYRNSQHIADLVFPRVKVGKEVFTYYGYPIGESFNVTDSEVGRTGEVNTVEFTTEEFTDKTKDYGLKDKNPVADIDNAAKGVDPLANSNMRLWDQILLGREMRSAKLAFDPTQYGADNKIALAGATQFSDDTSDPIGIIEAGLDAGLMRPNTMVMGNASFSILKKHPKILKAVKGTLVEDGIATRKQIADLFEIDEIIVGQSRLNTAKKGQPKALARVWGQNIGLFYRDLNASAEGGMTFGMTFQYGNRTAKPIWDDRIGLNGGYWMKSGEQVKEKIIAPDAGYLIQNVGD